MQEDRQTQFRKFTSVREADKILTRFPEELNKTQYLCGTVVTVANTSLSKLFFRGRLIESKDNQKSMKFHFAILLPMSIFLKSKN